jgi:hypothetical protein
MCVCAIHIGWGTVAVTLQGYQGGYYKWLGGTAWCAVASCCGGDGALRDYSWWFLTFLAVLFCCFLAPPHLISRGGWAGHCRLLAGGSIVHV